MSAGGIGWLGQQFPDYKMQITKAVPMAIGIYFIILIIAIFRDVRGKIQKTREDPSLKREALGEKNYLFEPEISRKVVAKNEKVLLTKGNETEKLEQNAMLGSATTEFKKFTEEKFVEPKILTEENAWRTVFNQAFWHDRNVPRYIERNMISGAERPCSDN